MFLDSGFHKQNFLDFESVLPVPYTGRNLLSLLAGPCTRLVCDTCPAYLYNHQCRVSIVSFETVITGVTQRWGGALRDDPNNGCEGDYSVECALCGNKKSQIENRTLFVLDLPSDMQFVLYPSHSGVDSLKPLITGRLKAPY